MARAPSAQPAIDRLTHSPKEVSMSFQSHNGTTRPAPSATGPIVAVARDSRAGSGVGLVTAILLLVVPGIAGLAIADQYKPTLTNALANGGKVLTPGAYQALHALALLALIGGVIIAIICVVRMSTNTPKVCVNHVASQDLPEAPRPGIQAPQANRGLPPSAFAPPAAETREAAPNS
jgi:hypothetical protein